MSEWREREREREGERGRESEGVCCNVRSMREIRRFFCVFQRFVFLLSRASRKLGLCQIWVEVGFGGVGVTREVFEPSLSHSRVDRSSVLFV